MARLSGQDYLLEIKPDQKVIHPELFNLPPDTPINAILMTIPELITRSNEAFSNFDIQVDGKSVGESRDVILFSTVIADVEKIEVSTSSVTTQKKNGEGGSINIIFKDPEKGLGGKVMLEATTGVNIMPSTTVGYSSGKLELTGNLNMQSFRTTSETNYIDYRKDRNIYGTDYFYPDFLQETARVNMKYSFTGNDVLKAWVIESSGRNIERKIQNTIDVIDGSAIHGPGWAFTEAKVDTTHSRKGSTILNAMAEYEHKFSEDSKITVFAGYQYSREDQDCEFTVPHTVDAEAKYQTPIVDRNGHKVVFKGGLNTTYRKVSTEMTGNNSLYLSPYVDFEYTHAKWKVKAALRYQMYDREFKRLDILEHIKYNSVEHDVIGNVNAVWQFHPHRALRFIASRNLVRPDDEMLYPELFWSNTRKRWIQGNPDLSREYIHTLETDFITDIHKDEYSIIISTGIAYHNANGLIEAHNRHDDQKGIFYQTFENTGINNIASADASVIFKYDLLTLSFTGNLFCNFRYENGEHDHYNYFNLNVCPVFNFKRGWTLNSKIQYNSKIIQKNAELGDCFLASIGLDKRYRNWTFSLEMYDIFEYVTEDTTITPESRISSAYDLYSRYIGIGVAYRFGNLR